LLSLAFEMTGPARQVIEDNIRLQDSQSAVP
jgi:hypothetical protein